MANRRDTPAQTSTRRDPAWTTGWRGWLVLSAGWLLPQMLLLGPALIGRTVNVPVDLLAEPHMYLPNRPEYRSVVPRHGNSLFDLVLLYPEAREFTAREFRAGRLPVWQPANFAGAPFAGWPKFSPFEALTCLAPGPVAVAWSQLLLGVTYGAGTWLFLRKALHLSYGPAALIGWCAPLTGFVTLWQGYPVAVPVVWLPWMLFLVHQGVARPWGWSTMGLAIVTGLTLLSGALDLCGLVLLTTGFYAVWLLTWERIGGTTWRRAASAATGFATAWLIGFAIGAPYLLPLMEYVRAGARIEARLVGAEERPPVGAEALPAVVLPNFYGDDRAGWLRIAQQPKVESSSTAYAGLLAAMWLAPLAWGDRRLRRESMFCWLLVLLALGWTLDVPPLVALMRVKPLNALSYNRWTFAAANSVLILAAIGLERLASGAAKFRSWFLLPMLLSTCIGLWCLFYTLHLPEPLYSQLQTNISLGRAGGVNRDGLRAAQHRFSLWYGLGAALSLAALAGWLATFRTSRRRTWWQGAVVVLLPCELFLFAANESRQADRAQYFPRIPALQELASLPPGRIWAVDCFPPNLNQTHGLEDIRGYDAVDPASFVELFTLACQPKADAESYALTLESVPRLMVDGNRLKLHPVADLLNVRYLVLRTPINRGFKLVVHKDDYWIYENPGALPRAFVPRSVRIVPGDRDALKEMASPQFVPRQTAWLSSDPHVPDLVEGTAAVRYESPTRVLLEADMRTDGLVVVSDLWDRNWKAELDGEPCPIYRVDVALRGLRIPTGRHRAVLVYNNAGLRLGLELAGGGAAVIIAWALCLSGIRRRRFADAVSTLA